MSSMTIIDALHDPSLLGALPAFHDLTTWRAWTAFLKVIYGLPMDPEDLALFRQHTGRTEPRPGGYPEAVCITGRQSGKSAVAAVACAFTAATGSQPGTYALLVAQDERSVKRTLFGYAREPFVRVPTFAAEVTRETADTLELASGVTLACYPCRAASVRGVRASIVAVDEIAFFLSSEGRPADVEMLRALRPCLATTHGKLLILSSPYGASGALFDMHRAHYGRDDSSTLVWQASAPEMNPTLPADYLERMAEDDPEAYRSEVLGAFRAGLAMLLDPDAIQACVASGVRERGPAPGRYASFADAASGSGKDAFTVAVAHADGERAVLDAVRAWRPPFNPSGVIAEAAALLKTYGVRETRGDRYAPGFVEEGFRAHGITYKACEQDRSQLYLELLPLVNSGRAVLLDEPDLLRELRGLERRRGTSGRDRVDHRPGSHDDVANAAAGALVLVAVARRGQGIGLIDRATGRIITGRDRDGNVWRNGEPWNGVFPPECDGKGRPLGYPARFVDGKYVGDVIDGVHGVKGNE